MKNETFNMWILWKLLCSKYDFLDFAPVWDVGKIGNFHCSQYRRKSEVFPSGFRQPNVSSFRGKSIQIERDAVFADVHFYWLFLGCAALEKVSSLARPFIHNKDHSVENGAAKMAFGCCQWPNDLDQCSLTAPFCVAKPDIFWYE